MLEIPKTKIVTFDHLGKAKIPSTATLSWKVKVSYKILGGAGCGLKVKIPNALKPVETEKEELRSCERASGEDSGVALSHGARPARPAGPAAAVYPRRSVCLFVVLAARLGWCWGPKWSLGEQDAEMRGPGWEVGGAVSGERKLYS